MQQQQPVECPHCGFLHSIDGHSSAHEELLPEDLLFGCANEDCPGRNAAIRVAAAGIQLVPAQRQPGWKWWHAATNTLSPKLWSHKTEAFLAADDMVVNSVAECVHIKPERFREWRISSQVESIICRL